MSNEYETLMRCVRSVRTKTDFVPKVALVLGSGLGDYASQLRVEAAVDYHEIEGFPVSTVPGHIGRFVFGYVGDVPVVCMQGRVHYYEGYSMTEVVRPIRLMKLLGAEVLFLAFADCKVVRGYGAGCRASRGENTPCRRGGDGVQCSKIQFGIYGNKQSLGGYSHR